MSRVGEGLNHVTDNAADKLSTLTDTVYIGSGSRLVTIEADVTWSRDRRPNYQSCGGVVNSLQDDTFRQPKKLESSKMKSEGSKIRRPTSDGKLCSLTAMIIRSKITYYFD